MEKLCLGVLLGVESSFVAPYFFPSHLHLFNAEEQQQTVPKYTKMVLLKKIPLFVLAFLAGLLSGVDTTISGGMLSLTAFLRYFFPKIYLEENRYTLDNTFCQYTNKTLICIAFLPYGLGMSVGFFTIWLQSRFGLKKLLIASTFLVSVGGLISLINPINLKCFLAGRIILGIGLAVFRQVVPKYLGEVPPRECRDWIDIVYDLSSTLGTLVGSVLVFSEFGNSNSSVLRLLCIPAFLFAVILFIISFFIPESPMHLMICHKEDMARQSLGRILDPDQVQEELDIIEKEANILREVYPVLEIFKKSSCPHLCIHLPSFIFRSFMGASTFLLFLPVFLIGTGLGDNASRSASLCTNITSLVVGSISAVLIHYFQIGRRCIILVGCVIVVTMQFALGTILLGYVGEKQDIDVDDFIKTLVIVLMCVFVAGTALVVNPMGWLSQSYPRTSHSVGSVFSRNASTTLDFLLSMLFLLFLCSIQARVFFIFGAVSALTWLFVYHLLPDGQWGDHDIWRRFVDDEEEDDPDV